MKTDREVSTNLLAAGLFHSAASVDHISGLPDTIQELLRFCIVAMHNLGEDVHDLVDDALDDQNKLTVALHARTELLMRNASFIVEGVCDMHGAESVGRMQVGVLAKSIGTLVGMLLKSSSTELEQGAALFVAAINAESEVPKKTH